jgi:hypothetical protein
MEFHENPSVENSAIPCGQTGEREDGLTCKASSRFSQLLCEKQLKWMPKISGTAWGQRVGTAAINYKILNSTMWKGIREQ